MRAHAHIITTPDEFAMNLRACFAKLRVEKKLYALRYEKDLSYRSL